VLLDDQAGDGKSQAIAAAVFRRAGPALVEPREDALLLLWRNTPPAIGDAEERHVLAFAPSAHAEGNMPPRRRELERIAQQVAHHLPHAQFVGIERWQIRRTIDRDGDALALDTDLFRAHHFGDQRRNGEGGGM